MNKGKNIFELKSHYLIFSIFLSLVVLQFFFGAPDFSLHDFGSLYLSQATLDGVSIPVRVGLIFKVLFGMLFLVSIFYWLFYYLFDKRLKGSSNSIDFLQVVALGGSVLLIANLVGIHSKIVIHWLLFVFLTTVLLNIAQAKYPRLKAILLPAVLHVTGFLAFILTGVFVFLFNSIPLIIENVPFIFMGIYFLLQFIFFLAKARFSFTYRQLFSTLILISLVPILIFIAIEVHFYWQQKHQVLVGYKEVFLGLFFLLGVAFLAFRKKINYSSTTIIAKFLNPSVILMLVILGIYSPFVEPPHDMYELANPAIAQMRMFKFGEIPAVDFLSSHLFSEQFYGLIYHFIHSYSGDLSFLVYKFINDLFFLLLVYFFLRKLFKDSKLALFFVVIFPVVYPIFTFETFYSVLALSGIWYVVQKNSIKSYLLFFASVIFLIFWKLDVGYSALLASFFTILLLFFTRQIFLRANTVAKSLLILMLFLLFLVLGVVLLRSPAYLITHLRSALHYFSATQAHGYSVITKAYNQQFFLYHILFPLVAMVLIFVQIFSLYSVEKREQNRFFWVLSSVFFLFIYVFNLQRGFVRHGFIEGIDSSLTSTFFLGVVLTFLSSKYFWQKRDSSKNNILLRYTLFYSLSFLLFVSFKYFPIGNHKLLSEKTITNPTILGLDSHLFVGNTSSRVVEDNKFAEKEYTSLVEFIEDNLSENQSFIDFSNTPMLYYYSQRKVPSYFCQSLQNTVDDYLQLQSINEFQSNDLPLAIYSHYPPNWWDASDGVPNALRYYLISEYLYKNYHPIGVLNAKSIWVKNGIVLNKRELKKDTLSNRPTTIRYKFAAKAINNHFDWQGKEFKRTLSFRPSDGVIYHYVLPTSVDTLSHAFLTISFNEAPYEGEQTVIIRADEKILGTATFNTSPLQYDYTIRLTNFYLWHLYRHKSLTIPEKEMKIKQIEIYQDLRK